MQKVVLITGCSSGIGLETALELADQDYKVYATMRDVSKSKFDDGNIETLYLDVDSEQSIEKAVKTILSKENQIDVLVNNAGYGFIGSIEDTSIDEIKMQMETDFIGPIRMIKKIIPTMKKQKSGKIINISSVAGQIGFALSSAYVSSKFALEGLTDSLRQELGLFGISISLVEPGVVKTNFHSNMKMAKRSKTSEYKEMTEIMRKQAGLLFEKGTEPTVVAKKISEIIKLENPEPRYVVGEDAKLLMENKKRMSGIEFEKSVQEIFKELMEFST